MLRLLGRKFGTATRDDAWIGAQGPLWQAFAPQVAGQTLLCLDGQTRL
jgi:hypothetical protein